MADTEAKVGSSADETPRDAVRDAAILNACYIYALYDPRFPDVIRYVGKTKKTLGYRLSSHISRARKENLDNHRCTWIRHLLSLGVSPQIRELATVDVVEWQAHERKFIADLGLLHPLTNGTSGGDGGRDMKATDESRRRMSEAHKGKVPSAGTRLKMSLTMIGNKYSLGYVHSAETRKKMAAGQRRRVMTAQHCSNISNSLRGNKNALGVKRSEETRKRMSVAQRKLRGAVNAFC